MDNWIWGLKNDKNGENLYMFEDLTRGRKPSEPDVSDALPHAVQELPTSLAKNASEAKSENRLKICQPQHQNHSIPLEIQHLIFIWLWINTYENTIFTGMNIHKSQLF